MTLDQWFSTWGVGKLMGRGDRRHYEPILVGIQNENSLVHNQTDRPLWSWFTCLFLWDHNPGTWVAHCVLHGENSVAKILLLNCTKYYFLWSNVSISSKQMPKQNVYYRGFVRLIAQIIGSGVPRGLNQGGNLSWNGPTGQCSVKSWEISE